MRETPETYLRRVKYSEDRRLKGDDGMRTTREVAESCGLTTAAARRKLQAAFDDDAINAFEGPPVYWQAK